MTIDIYQELLDSRIIYLTGEINSNVANYIVAQLLYLESKNSKADITLYINSPGGIITDGMAIFDAMRLVKPDIKTVCIGLAASMASFLLASGAKGKRYCTANSEIMIHQPLGGATGQTTDVLIHAERLKQVKEKMNTYLSEFTGKSYEQICHDTERDHYMDAEEAKKYGLIDHIYGEGAEV